MEKQEAAARRIRYALEALDKTLHEAAHENVHVRFTILDSFAPPHQNLHAEIFVAL